MGVVCTLVQVKANVDAADTDELTGLFTASESGHVNVVSMLVEAKANIDARTLDMVRSKNLMEILELLRNHKTFQG